MRIPPKKIIAFFILAGMCLWGGLLYSNTFHAPFVFDDEMFIVKNPDIRSLGIESLWHHLNLRKRIVTFFSFALNYHFHGLDVTGYHVVNLGIHLLAGLLVVWLVGLLFKTPRIRDEKIARHRNVIAFFVGWLFLSHPVQTESVTYIAQRLESLAALFYLAAVCFYLRGRISLSQGRRNYPSFLAAGISAVLGVFTKETVFTLPILLWVLEKVFFGSGCREKCPAQKSVFHRILPWLFAAGFALGTLWILRLSSVDLYAVIFEPYRYKTPFAQYFLTQSKVIVQYISLLFWPLHQNLDYDFPLSHSFLEPAVFLSFLGLAGILFAGIRSLKRYPLIGFGILWFFITLSVTSSIIPLNDVIFEHRLYLPSVGFLLALCSGFFYFIKKERIIVALLCCAVLFFSFLTYRRNAVWADDVTLWQDVAVKSPGKARSYANLGLIYRKRGEYRKAVENGLMALKIGHLDHRSQAQICVNLGAVFGELHMFEKEIYWCLLALKWDPRNSQAYADLGDAYSRLGNHEKALFYGKRAVKRAPGSDMALNSLGAIYARMGKYEEAVKCFKYALVVHPDDENAEKNLFLALSLIKQKTPEV